MAGILDGIGVVEAATFVAEPAAGTIMTDFGAEVLHSEATGVGDHRTAVSLFGAIMLARYRCSHPGTGGTCPRP